MFSSFPRSVKIIALRASDDFDGISGGKLAWLNPIWYASPLNFLRTQVITQLFLVIKKISSLWDINPKQIEFFSFHKTKKHSNEEE